MMDSKALRVAGVIFGVWLSTLYAYLADQINRFLMPGIPLPEPQSGYISYYLGSLFVGALIGLICTWPENYWLGGLLGGITGAVLVFVAPWQNASRSSEMVVGTLVLTITAFAPLALMLTPFGFLVRSSASRLVQGIGEKLTLRRVGVPILATALAVVLGISSQYSQEVRTAFYTVQDLVEKGMAVPKASQLPEPLKTIQGFTPNAAGSYTLSWSDAIERFMGPHPVTGREKSDFLIVVRFKNGFAFACIFSPGVKVPPCANYQ